MAECTNYFSTTELAKKRAVELRLQYPSAEIKIDARIFIPGSPAQDPCDSGVDRFYIEINGQDSGEGNVLKIYLKT